MSKPRIAIYVQKKYAKPSRKVESYNARAWPGLEMVRDDLERSGCSVRYCDVGTVSDYDVILVSITAPCDWYSFIAERVKWPNGRYKVLAGGAGLLNVRPFLEYVDAFIFGRAEGIVKSVVDSLIGNYELDDASVCYSKSFAIDRRYEIRQASECYPHDVTLADGKVFRESAIGCQRKCCFCLYSWSRKHVGQRQRDAGAGQAIFGKVESTMLELDYDHPETWESGGALRFVGLDGMSERLRMLANKPISNVMLGAFLSGLLKFQKAHRMRMYNIIGYPTETEDEYEEFFDILSEVDSSSKKQDKKWCIDLQNTPFRAKPCTPFAVMPMRTEDMCGRVLARFRRHGRTRLGAGRYEFFDGNAFWGITDTWTDSLPTVILEALVDRGTEQESGVIRKVACSGKFWRAKSNVKTATLEKYIDIDTILGVCRWDNLPTRYLNSYVDYKALANIAGVQLRKHGGIAGERLAAMLM